MCFDQILIVLLCEEDSACYKEEKKVSGKSSVFSELVIFGEEDQPRMTF